MDHLADVRRKADALETARVRYEVAMEARNTAIRLARSERHGPGDIGKAANMTPEQVRRICKTTAGEPTNGWSGKRKTSTK